MAHLPVTTIFSDTRCGFRLRNRIRTAWIITLDHGVHVLLSSFVRAPSAIGCSPDAGPRDLPQPRAKTEEAQNRMRELFPIR